MQHLEMRRKVQNGHFWVEMPFLDRTVNRTVMHRHDDPQNSK